MYHLDMLFLIQVYASSKFSPSLLETAAQVPAWYTRDFSMISVCSSNKNCPFAKYASGAVVVCRDIDIFGKRTLSLDHIL
jgi:hypothetical protein